MRSSPALYPLSMTNGDASIESCMDTSRSPRAMRSEAHRPSRANMQFDDDRTLALAYQMQQNEIFREFWDFGHQIMRQFKSDEELARRLEQQQHHELHRSDEDGLFALLLQMQEEDEQQRVRQNQQMQDDLILADLLHKEEISKSVVMPQTMMNQQDVVSQLNYYQIIAIGHVKAQATTHHRNALPKLEKRTRDLGYSLEDLRHVLDYIRDDAPIIIHLTETTLAALVEDTHYRSLFETNTSGGQKSKETRHKWEAKLFGGAYKKRCDPFDRPKYGCLNIVGDIAGVSVARRYGPMFLILQSHVRHRATFSNKDTGTEHDKALATSEYYGHVLMDYSDHELKAVLDLTGQRSRRIRGAACRFSHYKEVQIHGPIDLATDIQALSVPGRSSAAELSLQRYVEAFQAKTKCNILWQGE